MSRLSSHSGASFDEVFPLRRAQRSGSSCDKYGQLQLARATSTRSICKVRLLRSSVPTTMRRLCHDVANRGEVLVQLPTRSSRDSTRCGVRAGGRVHPMCPSRAPRRTRLRDQPPSSRALGRCSPSREQRPLSLLRFCSGLRTRGGPRTSRRRSPPNLSHLEGVAASPCGSR